LTQEVRCGIFCAHWGRSVVVNMSACQAEDRGFESRRSRHNRVSPVPQAGRFLFVPPLVPFLSPDPANRTSADACYVKYFPSARWKGGRSLQATSSGSFFSNSIAGIGRPGAVARQAIGARSASPCQDQPSPGPALSRSSPLRGQRLTGQAPHSSTPHWALSVSRAASMARSNSLGLSPPTAWLAHRRREMAPAPWKASPTKRA
jgi:hypothetical protein